MYRWAGVDRKKQLGLVLVLVCYSKQLLKSLTVFQINGDFSWHDMTFNLIGAGLFIGQEYAFSEQRFLLKMSTHRPMYSNEPLMAVNSNQTTTLADRASDLFGRSFPELFFKEYNGQTIYFECQYFIIHKQST